MQSNFKWTSWACYLIPGNIQLQFVIVFRRRAFKQFYVKLYKLHAKIYIARLAVHRGWLLDRRAAYTPADEFGIAQELLVVYLGLRVVERVLILAFAWPKASGLGSVTD